MEVKWAIEDVQAGRVIHRPGCNERWQIGYIISDLYGASKGNTYTLNSTADGMICRVGNKEAMMNHLNEHGYIPYRLHDYDQINDMLPK
jgi:hypothetical protein